VSDSNDADAGDKKREHLFLQDQFVFFTPQLFQLQGCPNKQQKSKRKPAKEV
jgi:hypothetical protein